MPNEITRARAFLYTRLNPDATLRGLVVTHGNPAGNGGEFVFQKRAPATAVQPYFIINWIRNNPSPNPIGPNRAWLESVFWVSLWTPYADDVMIEQLSDQADSLLHNKRGPILDGYVLDCLRSDAGDRPSGAAGDTSIQTILEYTIKTRVP